MLIRSMKKKSARQQGAVLIISLIFLLVITLLGITAMQTTTLDTKVVSNYKSYRTTFEGAEAAVKEGECRLIPSDSNFVRPKVRVGGTYSIDNPKIWRKDDPFTDCSNGNVQPDWWFSCESSWWQGQFSAGNVYAFSAPFYGLEDSAITSRPMYLFEQLAVEREPLNVDSQQPPKDYYRITARSTTGPNSQSNVMIQSVFAWRYRD